MFLEMDIRFIDRGLRRLVVRYLGGFCMMRRFLWGLRVRLIILDGGFGGRDISGRRGGVLG
jgi:hypothetical protein